MAPRETVVSENVVKGWLKSSLTTLGFKHWPIAAGKFSQRGISDRLAIAPSGLFCAFEAKKGVFRKRAQTWDRPEPTPAQSAFLEEVRSNGGLAMVVGPLEACSFEKYIIEMWGHILIPEAPGAAGARLGKATDVMERRFKHLDRIVERGF